jgi:hypothetical protein
MYRDKGYSLVEALATYIVIVALAALIVLLVRSCSGEQGVIASAYAKEYVEQLNSVSTNSKRRFISCMHWDTDNDGYISCNTLLTDAQGDREVTILCSANRWNKGCKAYVPLVN